MTLAETIQVGLNNPDCAFFVGQMFGETMILKIAVYLAILYLITKAAEKIALEPFLTWLKRKIYKGKGG